MADGDYYARNLAPKWRKVARTMEGGHEVPLVASLAREAFAETMRLAHGVPCLDGLVAAFVDAARTGDRNAWTLAKEEVRRAAAHHANTEQAALAGQALLENDGHRLRELDAGSLAQELAQATAHRIAQHHFARCRQGHLPETFSAIAELHAFERAAIARMEVAGLGAEMLRHQEGVGYKAPARKDPPAGTAALIGRSLVKPK